MTTSGGAGAGRRWLELRVGVEGDPAESPLPDLLVAAGARGVVEEDGNFVAYFEEPNHPDDFGEEVRALLSAESGRAVAVSLGWKDHEEWTETWKRGLEPRRVGERIVVHPSWKEPTDVRADDVVIVLDPGMAFGTAEHGTTRGCLRLLQSIVRAGDRVLDVGAGSGILSIAAARLGAAEVRAIEGDALACEAMTENLERNGVEDRVTVEVAWADAESLSADRPFDVVVANIETGLLRPLLPGLAAVTARNLLASGILAEEWPDFVDDLDRLGLAVAVTDADGEWRAGVFQPF